jgi:peptidoglycan/LPS O-acetylase OafA/YrhL
MIASPRELSAVVSGFQAAFLYSMNWYVIHQSAQHGSVIVLLNPALLFWSLAVEEQFYFVWPLLLAGLFAVTRRNLPIIRAVIAGGAVLSLTWALTASTSSRPYYRTDARAYELLVGALLALTPGVVRRCSRFADAASATGVVAFGALLFVASSTWHLGTMQRASVATAISFVIIVALEAAPEGIPARVLSLGPVVYLGLISYGIYLWQWPVILILSRYAHPNPWQMAAVAGLITTGLASLSYQILERPVREVRFFDRAPRVVIAVGLATTVVCALVVVPVVLRPRTHTITPTLPPTTTTRAP